MKKFLALTMMTALAALSAFAAEPGMEAMPFLRLPFSPVNCSMGAYTTQTAATLPLDEDAFSAGAGWMSFMPKVSRADYISGGASGAVGKFGGSVNFTRGSGEEIYGLDYRPTDLLVNAGAGFAFMQNLSLGVNASYAKQSITEDFSIKAIAVDVFLAGRYERLSFNAGLSSLGSATASEGSDKYDLPSSFAAAIGYLAPVAEDQSLRICAGLDYYFSGAAAGAIAMEYSYDSMLFVRGGYHAGGKSIIPSFASAGLGVRLGNFELDASYLFASETLGGSFNLGLVFHLPKKN